MKRVFGLFLGVLTAFGGFIDIGDLVADALVGARFGLSLAWVTVCAVLIIMCYAEMSGRIATVTRRPTFDVVRERLGPRIALADLGASFFVTGLLVMAELAGVALAIELASSVSYLLVMPVIAVVAWVVVWRLPFKPMESIYGLLGLAVIVFLVALFALQPDWHRLLTSAVQPSVPAGEGHPTYLFYAVTLLGAQATPYETFFFSSGAVEEKWSAPGSFLDMRANVAIGFPLGGLLAIAIQAVAFVVLLPRGISVNHLSESALPVSLALGTVGLVVVILAIFAVTFGAAIETLLSSGYIAAQYFGWSWGKRTAPAGAARFHALLLAVLFGALLLALTTVDPIKVTIYAVTLSAMTLPVTFFPLLVVANDRAFMGRFTNGRLANTLGTASLLVVTPAALAALPLLLWTKAGM